MTDDTGPENGAVGRPRYCRYAGSVRTAGGICCKGGDSGEASTAERLKIPVVFNRAPYGSTDAT